MAQPARTARLATLVASLLLLLGLAASATGGSGEPAFAAAGKSARQLARPVYDDLWRRKVAPRRKRWARRVAECESGRNPNAIGGGGRYRGAFQFARSTWRGAPRSPGGDPIAYSYRTQAFVAVRLMTRDGKGHWPNCP